VPTAGQKLVQGRHRAEEGRAVLESKAPEVPSVHQPVEGEGRARVGRADKHRLIHVPCSGLRHGRRSCVLRQLGCAVAQVVSGNEPPIEWAMMSNFMS